MTVAAKEPARHRRPRLLVHDLRYRFLQASSL
jgi:hypothetical protein